MEFFVTLFGKFTQRPLQPLIWFPHLLDLTPVAVIVIETISKILACEGISGRKVKKQKVIRVL